jgi:xylan 1,4-beta-xylosidase
LKCGAVVPPVTVDIDLDEVKYPKLPVRDYFKGDTLPHHYKTLRLPLDKIGSLTERQGYLRLWGQEAITSWNNQSLVARRLQHFDAQATTKVEFDPKTFQQMAGLTVIYDTYNFFYLYMSKDEESGENCLRIIVRDNLKFYNPIENGRVLIGDATSVYLRVRVRGLRLDFSFSLDGENYTSIATDLDGSDLSDEAYGEIGHEGHTGTFIGMACQDLSGLRACADFEFFEYFECQEK